MKEDDFVVYLAAYMSIAASQLPKIPNAEKLAAKPRPWAVMAIAAYDVTTRSPLRTLAQLTAEVDRVCAGIAPTPPKD